MSQPLPLTPQFPSLDGRLSVPRDRPADDGERSTQRHNFGKLLDRFTQSDRGQDQAKDPVTAPQDQRPRERCSTTDESPRPVEDSTTSETDSPDAVATPAAPGHATAHSAKPAPDACGPAPAPVATEAQASVAVVPVAATAAAPPATEVTPAAAPTGATVATAVPAVAASAAAAANTQTLETPAATAAPKAATQTAESAAEPAAPEATADAFALAPVAVPAARMRRTAAANGAAPSTAKTAAAASAEKAAAEITAPQPGRLPAARVEADPSAAADSNRAQPVARIIKVDGTAAAVDATALAGARDERDAAQSGADQLVTNLTGIDSPRRTAALYHKVADAAKPGADTPTPADQISIRLVHAVAEGKRAIQMHLHPAELGSIDVKMQWQGDKLTAQFTVDRPETLQLLQREVPALERSLGQAGVNVDSGSLSFSLRQQQGNGRSGGDGFDQAAANAGLGDGGDLAAGEDTLGQVIRDGILSIRV